MQQNLDFLMILENHLKMLYEFVQQYAPDKITTHSQYASFAYQIIENHIQKIGEKL